MAIAVDRGYWNQLQNDAERRWRIPPGILDRTMGIESAYRPDVISGETRSSAGAIGGMQLMPDTARRLGVDPLDPVQATEGAARLWREALDRYDGNIKLAAADYNMGAPGVAAVLRGEREFPEETVNYMARFDDFLPASATAPPARPPAPANAPPARPIPLQPQQQPQQQPLSLDDMLMAELTRQPEQRQNNVFDFMGQIAPLVAASMGNPQMIGVTSMVAQQLANMRQQEADREDARQDRLLQLAVLRGKDTRTPKQRDIEYFMQNPEAAQMEMQLRQASTPQSYTPYTIPGTGETGVVEKTTGERVVQTPGRTPEQIAEQERTALAERARTEQAVEGLPAAQRELQTIDSEIESTSQLLEELKGRNVSGPIDYARLKMTDPDLANRLEMMFSQGALDRLQQLSGAASDKDLEIVFRGTPSMWATGKGGEEAIEENLNRRLRGLQRLERNRRSDVRKFQERLGDQVTEFQPRSFEDLDLE